LNLHKTSGIVLRSVKYGETSVIVSIFTELFGIQSYLVNGVRTTSKKSAGKINLFQPAAILQLVVYHNDQKNLQRIRESSWEYLYEHIFFHVTKNAVALFVVELLSKCLKQPEANASLFKFTEDLLIHLDKSSDAEMANYPLFYALHLPAFLGIRINDNYSEKKNILDMQDGNFVSQKPMHLHYLEEPLSGATSQLLKIMQTQELPQIKLNREMRKILLNAYQNYYALQIQDFGVLKSLSVLQTVVSG
jgi:DNA repair protein RecO (recombination protein O)